MWKLLTVQGYVLYYIFRPSFQRQQAVCTYCCRFALPAAGSSRLSLSLSQEKKIAQDHVKASGGDIFVRSDWRSRARSANSLGAEPPGTWSSFLLVFRSCGSDACACSLFDFDSSVTADVAKLFGRRRRAGKRRRRSSSSTGFVLHSGGEFLTLVWFIF